MLYDNKLQTIKFLEENHYDLESSKYFLEYREALIIQFIKNP